MAFFKKLFRNNFNVINCFDKGKIFCSKNLISRNFVNYEKIKQKVQKGPSLSDFINGFDDFGENQKNLQNKKSFSDDDHFKVKNPSSDFNKSGKPKWLKSKVPSGENYERLRDTVNRLGLATVCQEARCPNIGECWGGNESKTATATIMLMGDTCTRGCRFCAVKTARKPPPLNPAEPENVASAVAKWGLDYVVLTSVDRDDVSDGGANHIAKTVKFLKKKNPKILVEVLTPDFGGNETAIKTVVDSKLDVFAHNVETVEACTPFVRDRRANYRQSLKVLEKVKNFSPKMITKTSLMLGVGERDDEIKQTLRDLRLINVDVVTFGQYLRPTKRHMKVASYVRPEKFDFWKIEAEKMGFLYVASGPLVRSSYKAGEFFLKNILKQNAEQSEKVINKLP